MVLRESKEIFKLFKLKNCVVYILIILNNNFLVNGDL